MKEDEDTREQKKIFQKRKTFSIAPDIYGGSGKHFSKKQTLPKQTSLKGKKFNVEIVYEFHLNLLPR